MQDTPPSASDRPIDPETLALLALLAMSEADVAAGRVMSMDEAFDSIRREIDRDFGTDA